MRTPVKPVVIDGRNMLRDITRYTKRDAKQLIGELRALLSQKIIPDDVLGAIHLLNSRRMPVSLANVAETIKSQPANDESVNGKSAGASSRLLLATRRGTKLEYGQEVLCSDCGKERRVLWQFKSNRGVVQLCETCKAEAYWRSFKMQELKLKHRSRIKVIYPVAMWCSECGDEFMALWQFESSKGTVELCGRCKEKAFKRSFLGNRSDSDALDFSVSGGSFKGD